MKGFGFTLNEIADFLDLLKMKAASCENVSQKMLEKAHLIDIKIKELEEIKTLMLKGVTSCVNSCPDEKEAENCRILTTDDFSIKK